MGYHFSTFLPVIPQATQKNKAEVQIGKALLSASHLFAFSLGICDTQKRKSFSASSKLRTHPCHSILPWKLTLQKASSFPCPMVVPPTLPQPPLVSALKSESSTQHWGTSAGHPRRADTGKNIFENKGLMDSEWGCELCFHEHIIGARWILQWRTRKKTPPYDLGGKLQRLYCKSCNECWLLVNGSPLAEIRIQPLRKRISKPDYFQAISEKEGGEEKSSFTDWAVHCELLAWL